MKKLLTVFFISFGLNSSTQPVITDSSLIIKPYFTPGESKTYLVTEECRMNFSFLLPVTTESQYKITFKVLDTTQGYSILYSVQTVKTSNKRMPLESFKAKMANNINFVYKLNKQGWVVDLSSFNETRQHLINAVDSLVAVEQLSERDRKAINYIRKDLEDDRAVEGFLKPLLLFNDIFTKPMFRNHKDYHAASRMNIFYKPTVPGTMIQELKEMNKKDSGAQVSVDFIGNPASMAKYANPIYQEVYEYISGKPLKDSPAEIRNDSQRNYEVMLQSGWPAKIHDKLILVYIQKLTYQTIMILQDP